MALVLYEKKGKIAYITLNRPEKMNSLNAEMINELAQAWVDFRDDRELWVAVLSGAGRAFCAGGDLSSLGSFKDYPILNDPVPPNPVNRSPALLSNPSRYGVTKPVIGAIHGYALGGGLWLALETDIKIAVEDTLFGTPGPRFGNTTKIALHLLYYTTPALASELLYLGDHISAGRALEAGLINRTVPSRDDLMPAAAALAERICENSPLAVSRMKEAILRWRSLGFQTMSTFMEYIAGPLSESEDFKEGRNAFVEKRKPVWKCK